MDLIDQLLTEIRQGRRVLMAAESRPRARVLLTDLAERLSQTDDRVTVRRANGMERVEHGSGGWVRFGTVGGQWFRGLTADTLFVASGATDAQMASIAPCLYTSADPRVVRL